MKSLVCCVLGLVLGFLPRGPAVISRSRVFDVRSGRETYRIWIAQPRNPNARGSPDTMIKRKPIAVYVLDGNWDFDEAVGATRTMQWSTTPPLLIVGIGSPTDSLEKITDRRGYDLTPPSRVVSWEMKGVRTGGAEHLLSFIQHQLKPFVAAHYGVDPSHSMIVGHSLGGNLVLYALAAHPGMFDMYLATSPSLWYGGRQTIGLLSKALVGRRIPLKDRIYVAVGSLEGTNWTHIPQKAWEKAVKADGGTMESGVLDVRSIFRRYPTELLHQHVQIVSGANHHTVQGIAYSRGFPYLLAWARHCTP